MLGKGACNIKYKIPLKNAIITHMEYFLIAILQFLGELIINVFAYVPFEGTSWFKMKPERERIIHASSFMLVLGGGLGWLSTLVWDHTFIEYPVLRIVNLILSPIIAAFIALFIAEWLSRKDPTRLTPRNHFWWSFWFTVGFAATRFVTVAR